MAKPFKDLTEREILALAITSEEEDARTYATIAEALQKDYPGTAKVFQEMKVEEEGHRRQLADTFQHRFGDTIPLIRRQDVKGFVRRQPVWLSKRLSVDKVRKLAASMETETRNFYQRAAERTTDLGIRQLLLDLAEAEKGHVTAAEASAEKNLSNEVRDQEDEARRKLFVLQIIQPGLAGLMDGSVSTLAPLFAAAFAAQKLAAKTVEATGAADYTAFKVGMAASIGAGISMGFAEALSDDGSLTGRGKPLIRGVVCGLMTTAGGIGHTLPFLIPNFHIAFWTAIGVVAFELAVIAWIRHRFMDSPWLVATLQVVLGGIIVLLAGILIGGE